MDECKPPQLTCTALPWQPELPPGVASLNRGLHSFPFQLNLSSSVRCITQLNS